MLQYIVTHDDHAGCIVRLQKDYKVETLVFPSDVELPVNQDYLEQLWGLPFNHVECRLAQIHRLIWMHFLTETREEWCVIRDTAALPGSDADLDEIAAEIPHGKEVFFPFTNKHLTHQLSIQPAVLGYYWGAHFYFIKRPGAAKLLDMLVELRQPVDDELIALSMEGKLGVCHAESDIFEYDILKSKCFLTRKAAAYEVLFNHPAWDEQAKSMARVLLSKVADAAARADVKIVLHGGTLLGEVRHGGIMPWDDDIDLATSAEEMEKLIQVLNESESLEYRSWTAFFNGTPSVYYKIWATNGRPVERYSWKFPFVDIWIYEPDENWVTFKELPPISSDWYYPLHAVPFEGATFWMPDNPKAMLDRQYKGWSEEIVVYPYSHQLERTNFKQLRFRITVDEAGRMMPF